MSEDLDLRRSIQDAFARLPIREPHPEGVLRRARRLWFRKVLIAGSVALLLAASIVTPIALLWPMGRSGPAAPSIDAFGIRLDFPAGWDSRISYLHGTPGPTVEAATFALPPSGPDSLYLATKSMEPNDVVLSLHDFTGACPCAGFEVAQLPIDIGPGDFLTWSGLDEGRSFAERSVQVNGRSLDLWVEFGTNPPSGASLAEVDTILASIELASSPGTPTAPAADTWKPPTFEPAEGWNVASTGPVPVGTEGLSVTWAANVPFKALDLRDSAQVGQLVFTPRKTMQALPADGVVLVTDLPLHKVPATPGPGFPERELPLQIFDAEVQQSWEGQVAPNVPFYLVQAVVNEQYVEVRAFFGTQDPSPETLRAAQEELNRLVVPDLAAGQGLAVPGLQGDLAIAARIQVPGAVSLATGYGSVWVSGFGELTRVDPVTGSIETTIPVKGVEDFSRVTIGEGSVWVSADAGIVYRVDPETNEVVTTIQTGLVDMSLAVGAGYLWVAGPGTGPGMLVRIDLQTGQEVGTPVTVGSDPHDVVFDEGALWVSGGAGIERIDPATGAVTKVPGIVRTDTLAVGAGSIWSTTYVSSTDEVTTERVLRVDPVTMQVVDEIPVPLASAVAFADGVVWVMTSPTRTHPGRVLRIDPATDQVVGNALPILGPQPISIVAEDTSAWIADYTDQALTRIEVVASASPSG